MRPAVFPATVRRRRHIAFLLVAIVAAAAAAGGDVQQARAAAGAATCPQPKAGAGYAARVNRAVRAGHDAWGAQLLAAGSGPTEARARRYLNPLLLARAPKKRPLTQSGVHYVPFAQPFGVQGAGSVALHVADGSQIVAERIGGRSLSVAVGPGGREHHGACLTRLGTPRLAGGWLPILETRYVDRGGVRYAQESFAARIPETGSLVSFLKITADARGARAAAQVRLTPSVRSLRRAGNSLARATAVHLVFGAGGRFDGRSVRYGVSRGAARTVYAAWHNYPQRSRLRQVDAAVYEAARRSVTAFWERRLSEGTIYEVPEKRVVDAQRALLVQNLVLTWRYSIGNPYEQFSFPEGVDVAQVMGEYGHGGVSRSILRTSLTRKATPYPNWKMGEKLVGWALYHRLFRDGASVRQVTPVLRRYVATLGRQITASRSGLLGRERYSSDIPESVYGLHSQAVVWQGLREMGRVWAETGQGSLAAQCRRLAARLELGLRRAVGASQTRLRDGSLFVGVRLLDGERPYGSLMESRMGSYWNLVMPYALASGLFRPGGPQAQGILRYMLLHGSRLLGLVRAGAYALYREPTFPTSGTDHVYGINVARFLADNDRADHLVLSLYGALAAAMTPGTFVSGEAASVTPLERGWYRSMYLPPNGASNAAFLETLRLMLVHESRDAAGAPAGLELAHATPRAWLRQGRRIAVKEARTSFGPLSYAVESRADSVHATIDVPARVQPRTLRLRLRLPPGRRVTGVTVNGQAFARFDRRSETLDLSGRRGTLEVVATLGTRMTAHFATTAAPDRETARRVRTRPIRYRAHNGVVRRAYVLLPGWYGARNNPPLPLIISPHGRGLTGRQNAAIWGDLPGRGQFIVVNPDGHGRVLPNHSWGYSGQIADLAKMPDILARALPWLRVDRTRIYVFGGSMGGQEALLLLARHPRLLAGVAAFDSVVDFGRQYRHFSRLRCSEACTQAWAEPLGMGLQRLARKEVGGAPWATPSAYATRSPRTFIRRIATSCVPLQLWWSVADRIVGDQRRQSGDLFWELRRLNRHAPIQAFAGFWIHTSEMHHSTRLPLALSAFGLLPPTLKKEATEGVRMVPPPRTTASCVPQFARR